MTTAQKLLPELNWYDVRDPNSPDLDELAQRFHLHELQIEDCRHRPQRAKADEYGNYMFAVLKHLIPKDQEPEFDDFDVFLGPDFLITVHEGDCTFLDKLCRWVQENHVTRLDRILYQVTDLIVDEYLAFLDDSSENISKVESLVLEKPEPAVLREIFQLKRRLIDFRRNASGMRDAMNAIIRREGGLTGDDLDPYFRDVYDHPVSGGKQGKEADRKARTDRGEREDDRRDHQQELGAPGKVGGPGQAEARKRPGDCQRPGDHPNLGVAEVEFGLDHRRATESGPVEHNAEVYPPAGRPKSTDRLGLQGRLSALPPVQSNSWPSPPCQRTP